MLCDSLHHGVHRDWRRRGPGVVSPQALPPPEKPRCLRASPKNRSEACRSSVTSLGDVVGVDWSLDATACGVGVVKHRINNSLIGGARERSNPRARHSEARLIDVRHTGDEIQGQNVASSVETPNNLKHRQIFVRASTAPTPSATPPPGATRRRGGLVTLSLRRRTSTPTAGPSPSPTTTPTPGPTVGPTQAPTTPAPTPSPSVQPSLMPTTPAPTKSPVTPEDPTATPRLRLRHQLSEVQQGHEELRHGLHRAVRPRGHSEGRVADAVQRRELRHQRNDKNGPDLRD